MIVHTSSREGRYSCELSSLFYLQKRTIFLTEEITDAVSTEIIQQILYLSELNKDPICIYINSPGGSVSAGFAIYDTMKSCGCDIITVCCSTASSMAAFLLAAGTKGMRYCMPHAEVMIHQVMGGVQGQAADIEICAEHIRIKKNMMNHLLSEMTGQPVDKIRVDTDRDYYMSAEQAEEYGMVDRIGRPEL